MNAYITIGAYKYVTTRTWRPSSVKSGTLKLMIDGSLDVTYGPAVVSEWKGSVKADNTPASGYGTPAQLRTSLETLSGITFIDHDGVSHTGHVFGYDEISLLPDWDNANNSIYFDITIRAL